MIRQQHVKMDHSGTSRTWATVKEKNLLCERWFCNPTCNRATCCLQKRNPKYVNYSWNDLLLYRLRSFQRPFYNTSIDYFFPFMITQGRTLVRHYGLVMKVSRLVLVSGLIFCVLGLVLVLTLCWWFWS